MDPEDIGFSFPVEDKPSGLPVIRDLGGSQEAGFLDTAERQLPGSDVDAWRTEILRFEPNSAPHIVQEALDRSPPEFLEFIVTRTRPREVKAFQCIFRQGYITKKDCVGFDIVVTRDLRKEGVPFRQKCGQHFLEWEDATIGGKYLTEIPDRTRQIVLKRANGRCEVCLHRTSRLFPDHGEPRELVGDIHVHDPDAFKAYCQVCNNRKMRACRKCPNNPRNGGPGDTRECHTCKWVNPKNYTHEAMAATRRIVLEAFTPEDLEKLDKIADYASSLGVRM